MGCKDLHKIEETIKPFAQEIHERTVYEETCQCGKTYSKECFKCEGCSKYFCNNCPASPLENHTHCLECLFKEFISSTPTKNNVDKTNDEDNIDNYDI